MTSRAVKTPIFYGWIVAACAFSVLFVTYGVQYSFGIFVTAMVADLGWPRASLGAAFSLYGVVYMSFTMLSGRVTERFGPRRVITVGGVLLGIGIMSSSFVTAPWQLMLSYGVVAALGMSTAYIPCNMTVVRWFIQRRGLAVGLSSSGASSGVLVVPLLVLTLIEFADWRVAMFVCGIGLLIVTVLAARFMIGDPNDLGLHADGVALGESSSAADSASRAADWNFIEARKTMTFWLFLIGFAVALVTMTIPFVHVAEFANDLGLSRLEGAAGVSVIGLFALGGGIGLGALSDRTGPKFALQLGLTSQLLAFGLFYYAIDAAGLYAACAAFGVFYGGFVALFPALLAKHFGRSHVADIGGFVVGGAGLLGAWGPVLAGHLRDISGSYESAFIFSIVVAALAFVLFALMRTPRRASGSAAVA